MSLSFTQPTALLLIDAQNGFAVDPNTPSHWGTQRSNPHLEENLSTLLRAFRTAKSTSSAPGGIHIIHIYHSSTSRGSPLHPAADEGRGIQPLEIVKPADDGSEPVLWKSVNSAFAGTELEKVLRAKGIRQLVVAGITTDHCVSTSVRMAANLGVVDRWVGPDGVERGRGPLLHDDGRQEQEEGVSVDKGRIVLVGDATTTWAKGGFDAETVHGVTLASLNGEFADVMSTAEVIRDLQGRG
ncbi:Isochorismatase-like protein [Aspergillus heterothallicus]